MNFLNFPINIPNPPAPLASPPPLKLNNDQGETGTIRTQRTEEIRIVANAVMETIAAPSTLKRNTNPYDTQSDSGEVPAKKQRTYFVRNNQEHPHANVQPPQLMHQVQKVGEPPSLLSIEDYFNRIRHTMNPNLDPSVNDPQVHYEFDSKRDRWHNMLPSRWAIATTRVDGVERLLNANLLSYEDEDGRLVNTSFARSQAPAGTCLNVFYQWIIDKMVEGKKSYIFNLLSLEEQKDPKKFTSYYGTGKGELLRFSNQENAAQQGKEEISVKTTNIEEIGNYRTYHLDITMKRGDVVIKQGQCDVVNYVGLLDTKRTGFLQEFDEFVGELIAAKQEGNRPVVVHCGAGRGRTGVAIAAAILRESIRGDNDLEINKFNFKDRVCNLVVELRNRGGGHTFVQDPAGLSTLFNYASYLLE